LIEKIVLVQESLVSLGSQVIMEFTQDGNPTKEILLTPRSLVMMYGEARYN